MDLKNLIVQYGFSVIVAPLTVVVVQLAKKYVSWVEDLKAWPKRMFVAVTVAIFLALGAVLGVDFGISPDTNTVDFLLDIDKNVIKTALGAGFAFLLHALKKAVKK